MHGYPTSARQCMPDGYLSRKTPFVSTGIPNTNTLTESTKRFFRSLNKVSTIEHRLSGKVKQQSYK